MGLRGHGQSVVVSNPGILGGTPVILGTRVPADNILAEVLAGKPLVAPPNCS